MATAGMAGAGRTRRGRPQGALTPLWAQRGSRPTAVRQTRYERTHLCAAIEPATGASTSLIAPELNPIERVWAYMRSHQFSSRAFAEDNVIVHAGADSWRSLTSELLRFICRCDSLDRGESSRSV